MAGEICVNLETDTLHAILLQNRPLAVMSVSKRFGTNDSLKTYPLANLFHSVPRVSRAASMLAEKHGLRHSVFESYDGVLPIPDVVPESYVEDLVAEVEAVKEKIKRVNDAISFVYHEQDHWCVTSPGL